MLELACPVSPLLRKDEGRSSSPLLVRLEAEGMEAVVAGAIKLAVDGLLDEGDKGLENGAYQPRIDYVLSSRQWPQELHD